jgi:hypothetical protein
MEIIKSHATGGYSVDMGCFDDRMSGAAQIISAMLVRDEEEEIWPLAHWRLP